MDMFVTTGTTTHNGYEDPPLISDSDREMYMVINCVVINFTISLFGVVTNIMNIIVFLKQGLDNTINISFFGLAISDLCSLVAVIWFSICINPLLAQSDIPIVPMEVINLTAGFPLICFARITGWITVFVTAERCLCITMPLKIKQIITPKITTVTICLIYVGIIVSFVPEYQTAYLSWKFYPLKNKTLLGMDFTENRKEVEGLVFMIYSVLGQVSFIAVIVFTVILVVQLERKSKWRSRSQANLDKSRPETISNRDKKTMTMVVIIAIVLIVCFTPGVIISFSAFLLPNFTYLGKELNAFFVTWSFAFIFQVFNSSVNIFVYYRMSTKYRETFQEIFLKHRNLKINTCIPNKPINYK